jgi:hypothetical protein
MLMLLTRSCPYYLDFLSPDERWRDESVYDAYQKIWQAQGIRCSVASGRGFLAEDFVDRYHLAPSGGRKMASLVAGQIHQFEGSRP